MGSYRLHSGIWGGSFGFQYDALDNLRRSSGPGQDWTWHYNAATWRLDRLAPASGPNIAVYGYDTRGNVISRNAQTFSVDLAGRVTQVGPNVASYRYDGHGRRMLITKGATRTVQVYSQAGQLVYEAPADAITDRIFTDGFQSGGNGSKRYIYFGNHLIAEDGSAGLRYLHTDALGSPVARTNAAGTITERSYHFPYGRTVSPPVPGPGYTGHVTDTETGLSYMQARYYDPWAGRFLATDPVAADAGSFNRYWYANNSPYANIDPDGRESANVTLGLPWNDSGGTFEQKLFAAVGLAGMGIGGISGGAVAMSFLGAVADVGLAGATVIHTPQIVTAGGIAAEGLAIGAGIDGPAQVASLAAPLKGRTFTSSDPLVGELATKIDAMYPGHVVGVNIPVLDSLGKLVTDADILLKNGIIQVKSGGGKGMTNQLMRTEQATGLPTLGYGPNLKQSILRSCAATNCEQTIIEVVRP